RPGLLAGEHSHESDWAESAAERLNAFPPQKVFHHGQKISSLLESSACAYSASLACARYVAPRSMSAALGSHAKIFRNSARTLPVVSGSASTALASAAAGGRINAALIRTSCRNGVAGRSPP